MNRIDGTGRSRKRGGERPNQGKNDCEGSRPNQQCDTYRGQENAFFDKKPGREVVLKASGKEDVKDQIDQYGEKNRKQDFPSGCFLSDHLTSLNLRD